MLRGMTNALCIAARSMGFSSVGGPKGLCCSATQHAPFARTRYARQTRQVLSASLIQPEWIEGIPRRRFLSKPGVPCLLDSGSAEPQRLEPGCSRHRLLRY